MEASEDDNDGLPSMELALYVLDGQEKSEAQEALLKMAVVKADTMDDSALLTSKTLGILLKWTARSEDKDLFDAVVEKLANADTCLVGLSIQYLLQYLNESEAEKRAALAPIVAKHGKWLEDEIQSLDTKFTWEMPNASVSRSNEETEVNDKVEAFLRGGEVSMTTKGVKSFKDFQEAQNFASKYPREKQKNCSFELEATRADVEVVHQDSRVVSDAA
ncbi:hypothetical protein P3T76_006101 [Phytophthora citrophthora]|uniref:Uncharacterized protein n=1 Tax=Phytophthora citrophthora TaxID=4793 RepID=A0AAD9GPX9_9STRA|nr:hypothetical protein P3T76_006101 [Phytophthora citrophthora]